MRRYLIEGALLALLVGGSMYTAAGCFKGSGSAEGGGPNTQQLGVARNYFIQSVYATMSAQCGGCHAGMGGGTVFISTTPEDTYTMLENTPQLIDAPARSQLLTHIHTNKSVAVSAELRDLLMQWLTLEANARGITNTAVKPANLQDAYNQFAQCMTFDLWTITGMGNLPFTQTDTDGPCLGCHGFGQGGAWLSGDPLLTFKQSQTFPYIEKLVVGRVDANGNFDSLIASRRFIEKANETCAPGATTCHPTYGLPPEVEGAVNSFVDTTLQNLQGGTCGLTPPQPVPEAGPPDAGD